MLNNLFPKSSKLKKSFYPRKLRIKKMSDNLLFGNYGIKTKKNTILYLKNLESLKKNANKILKKIGKI
jgi:ribosomal protein L16/L10AE